MQIKKKHFYNEFLTNNIFESFKNHIKLQKYLSQISINFSNLFNYWQGLQKSCFDIYKKDKLFKIIDIITGNFTRKYISTSPNIWNVLYYCVKFKRKSSK